MTAERFGPEYVPAALVPAAQAAAVQQQGGEPVVGEEEAEAADTFELLHGLLPSEGDAPIWEAAVGAVVQRQQGAQTARQPAHQSFRVHVCAAVLCHGQPK